MQQFFNENNPANHKQSQSPFQWRK